MFVAWPQGAKGGETDGTVLFEPGQVEPHTALELIDRGLRLALANERGSLFQVANDLGSFDAEPKEKKGSQSTSSMPEEGGVSWDGPARPAAKSMPWIGPTRPDMAHRLR